MSFDPRMGDEEVGAAAVWYVIGFAAVVLVLALA